MKHYIGVDVGKYKLDVDWLGNTKAIDNDATSIKPLVEQLKALQEEEKLALVVCEPTGGYEQKLVNACRAANLPIHIAHANKVRHFAKSQGLLAKTDKLDSRVLSDYGRLFKPKADEHYLSENSERVRELLKRREQLLSDKKREQNRLDKIDSANIKQLIEAHIKWLDKAIKKIGEQLSEFQKADDIKVNHKLMTSLPGIGHLSAHYLQAFLPELGKLPHNKISALVGVAPFNNDSGTEKGKRFIKGGRSGLREVLYMAALTSTQYNPELKKFYQRLRGAGKPAKVAIIAVMRKLLTMINSIIKRGTPWQATYERNIIFC